MRWIPAAPVALLMLLASVPPARAAWPTDPLTNVPLCTAVGTQQSPRIVTDGAGGAIVAWHDYRSLVQADVYAQHVSGSGVVDGAWPADGLALCTETGNQIQPTLVPDGAGGAIVTWMDSRGGSEYDVYAQHVLASGAADGAWPVNGLPVCLAAGHQFSPTIAPDGAGGAFVVWLDLRVPGSYDVYAQHVLGSGSIDGTWPLDGVAVCTAPGIQEAMQIVADGSGGATVTWGDERNGAEDIYAQHLLGLGGVDASWPIDGAAVCTATSFQEAPTIVSDGTGGAVITWMDFRNGGNLDIYTQHLLASGSVDGAWPADGRALCVAADHQSGPASVSDGAGGAIVIWRDLRSATAYDVYAGHILATGVVDAAWPADGRALGATLMNRNNPVLAPDGSGGAIVSWDQQAGGGSDIYAQHVLASGGVDGSWPADGRAVSTAPDNQSNAAIVSNGAGDAIVTWTDSRTGNSDIYAQGDLAPVGSPEIASALDIPGDQGGWLRLTVNASALDVADVDPPVSIYGVWRRLPESSSLARIGNPANRTGIDMQPDDATRDGLRSAMPAGLDAVQVNGRWLVTGGERGAASGASAFPAGEWELVASMPALQLAQYRVAVPTISNDAPSTFVVTASTTTPSVWFISAPASGQSVDNLAPSPPTPFTGLYAGGATHLQWGASPEPDAGYYRLYRGTSASFTPGAGNLIASVTDIGYVDIGPPGRYYKLSALDVNGNESSFALVTPGSTADAGHEGPLAFALAGPSPNPAHGGDLNVEFALPTDSPARLELLDSGGRRVRTREVGPLGHGRHVVNLSEGRPIAPGLYWVRLTQGTNQRATRVAVL